MLNNISCYEVKTLIHETKDTAVYEGECLVTNERVAIKVIKKDAVLNLSYSIKNVTSEIQILKITKHKNVDSLYQIIEDNNNIYLIKEYVNGSNLYDTLNTTCVPLSEDVSAKIILDIIDVLIYLRELSIYHGGISLENILLDTNTNSIKVIGFSEATFLPNAQQVSIIPFIYNNKQYHAPEIINNNNNSSSYIDIEKANVWTCGIILYTILNGTFPDYEKDINCGKFGKCSSCVCDLLKHMLDVNVNNRFGYNDIIQHEFIREHSLKGKNGGLNIFDMVYPVDWKVLNIVEQYGYDKKDVEMELKRNVFTEGTAVYKMLVRKVRDLGFSSCSDLCSMEYKMFKRNKANRVDKEEASIRFEKYVEEYFRMIKEDEGVEDGEMLNCFEIMNELDELKEDVIKGCNEESELIRKSLHMGFVNEEEVDNVNIYGQGVEHEIIGVVEMEKKEEGMDVVEMKKDEALEETVIDRKEEEIINNEMIKENNDVNINTVEEQVNELEKNNNVENDVLKENNDKNEHSFTIGNVKGLESNKDNESIKKDKESIEIIKESTAQENNEIQSNVEQEIITENNIKDNNAYDNIMHSFSTLNDIQTEPPKTIEVSSNITPDTVLTNINDTPLNNPNFQETLNKSIKDIDDIYEEELPISNPKTKHKFHPTKIHNLKKKVSTPLPNQQRLLRSTKHNVHNINNTSIPPSPIPIPIPKHNNISLNINKSHSPEVILPQQKKQKTKTPPKINNIARTKTNSKSNSKPVTKTTNQHTNTPCINPKPPNPLKIISSNSITNTNTPNISKQISLLTNKSHSKDKPPIKTYRKQKTATITKHIHSTNVTNSIKPFKNNNFIQNSKQSEVPINNNTNQHKHNNNNNQSQIEEKFEHNNDKQTQNNNNTCKVIPLAIRLFKQRKDNSHSKCDNVYNKYKYVIQRKNTTNTLTQRTSCTNVYCHTNDKSKTERDANVCNVYEDNKTIERSFCCGNNEQRKLPLYYNGPIDVSCICHVPLNKTKKYIVDLFKKQNAKIKQVSNWEFQTKFFTIEIRLISQSIPYFLMKYQV